MDLKIETTVYDDSVGLKLANIYMSLEAIANSRTDLTSHRKRITINNCLNSLRRLEESEIDSETSRLISITIGELASIMSSSDTEIDPSELESIANNLYIFYTERKKKLQHVAPNEWQAELYTPELIEFIKKLFPEFTNKMLFSEKILFGCIIFNLRILKEYLEDLSKEFKYEDISDILANILNFLNLYLYTANCKIHRNQQRLNRDINKMIEDLTWIRDSISKAMYSHQITEEFKLEFPKAYNSIVRNNPYIIFDSQVEKIFEKISQSDIQEN